MMHFAGKNGDKKVFCYSHPSAYTYPLQWAHTLRGVGSLHRILVIASRGARGGHRAPTGRRH